MTVTIDQYLPLPIATPQYACHHRRDRFANTCRYGRSAWLGRRFAMWGRHIDSYLWWVTNHSSMSRNRPWLNAIERITLPGVALACLGDSRHTGVATAWSTRRLPHRS